MSYSPQQNKILNTISSALPDDRPITAIQIVHSPDKCPSGFFPIAKTYDADQDADLWREGSFLKINKVSRYLCLSKSEGLPGFIVKEIIVLNDKAIPPEGYSLLYKTVDTDQKAWRKRQLCYKLVPSSSTSVAVTDIIVCSRLKKAPEGFTLAGEINGVIVCYKMGNVQDTQNNDATSPNGQQVNGKAPERPPKPAPPIPTVYPNLNDGDHDYEILNPGFIPSRPAPPRPQVPNPAPAHSTHTLSTAYQGLEGVPFVVNPKFLAVCGKDTTQHPIVKAKTMEQLLKEYSYNFSLERQAASS